MDKQKQTFVKQWEAKFPGTAAPNLEFKDVETIEQELRNCKENVKKLEEQLNQAKFQMIFLQVCIYSPHPYGILLTVLKMVLLTVDLP